MKIFSALLNTEIEFECDLIDGKSVIPHRQLEDLFLNRLMPERGARYGTELVHVEVGWVIVSCVISDDSGRRIEDWGEATKDSLATEIARQNPAIMARNRAFDRAVIRYLGLPDKAYSSEEIPTAGRSRRAADAKPAQTAPTPAPVPVPVPAQQPVSAPQPAPTADARAAEPAKAPEKPAPATEHNPGATIINFGKHQGKAIAQVAEENAAWVKWCLAQPTTEVNKAVQDDLRLYLGLEEEEAP